METWEVYQTAYPDIWLASGEDPWSFVSMLAAYGIITWDEADEMMGGMPAEVPAAPAAPAGEAPPEIEIPEEILPTHVPTAEELLKTKEEAASAIADSQRPWYYQAFYAALDSFWNWIKATVGDMFKAITDWIKSTFEWAWQKYRAIIDSLCRDMYNSVFAILAELGEITPERVPAVSLKLYEFAFLKGIEAHLNAFAVEVIHPYKNLGLQQISAMIGDYAGFAKIAGSTIGVVQSVALAGPMRYAVMAHCRPVIPDDRFLEEMAVKDDISLDKLRDNLKYYGYSDYWIDRIIATMYREPNYTQLSYMAEDSVASDDWLLKKIRRYGFDAEDAPILVSSLIKKVARTQRLGFYNQAIAMYKQGFIDDVQLDQALDKLELRREAKDFARHAAVLSYLSDVATDQLTYLTDSYSKDLLTEAELTTHMSLLGIVPDRVTLLVNIARVKKYKKPTTPTAAQLAAPMLKVQSTYSSAYIQLYRKGTISQADLEADLHAIGITPELAKATAFLEAARKG